jgi:PAS domain-containing protein
MVKQIIDAGWLEQLPFAITVCDRRYKILYMNEMAAENTAEDGGRGLIGKSLLDCHPPEAQKKLKEVMASGRPNIYTIERKGVRKMVNQSHWRRRGRVAGLLEIVFVLPREVPHHVRT